MGIDFNAEIVFPPDDTGFGFDNVGDALSISPMLLEKYVQSAAVIVNEAVPMQTWTKPTVRIAGNEFRSDKGVRGDRIRHNQPCVVTYSQPIQHAGKYRIQVHQRLHGSFEFHPGRYAIDFRLDDRQLFREEYKWEEHKDVSHEFEVDWQPGPHTFSVKLETLADKEKDDNQDPSQANNDTFVSYQLVDVTIVGPVDSDLREHPPRYKMFFTKDEPPTDPPARADYAREILSRFVTRAFRQPASPATVDRLVALAANYERETKSSFEAGIARAMTAVLASPKFLFKLETPVDEKLDASSNLVDGSSNSAKRKSFPLANEYTLASRMSYFLWSSMPTRRCLIWRSKASCARNYQRSWNACCATNAVEPLPVTLSGNGCDRAMWSISRSIQWPRWDTVASLTICASVCKGVFDDGGAIRHRTKKPRRPWLAFAN